MSRIKFHGNYGWTLYSPQELYDIMSKTSDRLAKILEREKVDALAFCGSSGSVAAFILGMTHKIPVVYVRKPNEESHGNLIESNAGSIGSYIIVDDFIDTGKTIRYIVNSVHKVARNQNVNPPVCKGVFLWSNRSKGQKIKVSDNIVLTCL